MSQTDKKTDDPILQWVSCKLDGETYGINVMQVQEVLRITLPRQTLRSVMKISKKSNVQPAQPAVPALVCSPQTQ